MARLYADEDFPLPVVKELRLLGHDVLTAQEAGRANQQIDDAQVLADATADNRAAITHNHADFKRLHRTVRPHGGIISCSQDAADQVGLARRVHAAIIPLSDLTNQFIRVVRPNPPATP